MQTNSIVDLDFMSSFPKVELHRHLEGTFNTRTLHRIAQKNKIGVPGDYEEFLKTIQFPKNHKPDFPLFLSKFRNDWYNTLQDVYDIAHDSVLNMGKEHLFYIELRFSPEHFSLKNNFNRVDVAKIIINACNHAAEVSNIQIKYIITFNRNKQTQEEMSHLFQNLQRAHLDDIVGIDLAGNELLNPASEFTNFFDEVKEGGHGITIHAGEVTSPKEIWDAILLLHATRIGHGTSAIKEKKLQEYLIAHKIILEQCPVSNTMTGSWPDIASHPFKKLHEAGVLVTLNSDDPHIQNTTLTDDIVAAAKYFGFSSKDLININIRSLEAAFLPEKIKKQLIKQYSKKAHAFFSS